MAKQIRIDPDGGISLSNGLVVGSGISGNPKLSKTSTSFTPTPPSIAGSVLLVGGGGSGGTYYAGGGGAGGGILKSSFVFPTQNTYDVVVGAGGNNSNGEGSGFNGGFCIGGGMGASGGDINGPNIFPTDGLGGGGAACGGNSPSLSYGATGDAGGQIKSGGNGLYDDSRPWVFDALGGGGGGYLTSGGTGFAVNKNGGDGTLVSNFFPDLLNTQLDWIVGCGGGGACNWAYEKSNYASGGFLGGAVNGTNYGGRGGGEGAYSSTNATNGFGLPSTGGAGNGGGGGLIGQQAGTGSSGIVLLEIPSNIWWDKVATQSASPYFRFLSDINGFSYFLWYGSGKFIM